MSRKIALGIVIPLLVTVMLTLTFNVRLLKASGTIYIRADGSVDPPTAPILRDGNLYTFTDNINNSIVIERDNIELNGAHYILDRGWVEPYGGIGIVVDRRSNIIVKDMTITGTAYHITVSDSSNVNIYGINIPEFAAGIAINVTRSSYITISTSSINAGYDTTGISISESNHVTISGSNITGRIAISIQNSDENIICDSDISGGFGPGTDYPIGLSCSSSNFNKVFRNNISWIGVDGSDNEIFCNNIREMAVSSASYSNLFYHNNIQYGWYPYGPIWVPTQPNIWDDCYPSGGNYWGEYMGTDDFWGKDQNLKGCDLIGDTPYIINENNTDNYPLMMPWRECKPPITEFPDLNGDGTVNILDIAAVAIRFGETFDQ